MGPFRALGLFGQAIRLLRREPELRRLTVVAAWVSVACFCTLAALLYWAVPAAVARWWPKPAEAAYDWLWYLLVAFTYLLSFVIAAQTLPVVVLSPVSERLSIATERVLGVPDTDGGLGRFVAETGRAVLKAIVRVGLLLTGHVLLLPLALVPALWSVTSALWSMLWLAFEYVDVTANRHGLRFGHVVRLLAQQPLGSLALGFGIYVLLWIPIVNVFFVPIAVVSATLFYRATS